MFEVLESTAFVARESRWVRIDPEAVRRFARTLARDGPPVPPWDEEHHYSGPADRVVAYLMVLDTINFCFWPPAGCDPWERDLGGRRVSGYNGLAAALKSAMVSGVPLHDAEYLCRMTSRDLEEILGGHGTLQLMDERARALRDLGEVLGRDYDGAAHRLVEATKGWAVDLARLLAKKLPSFRDTAVYRERAVSFYKRGQIFAADLHGALNGEGWGAFRDMDRLTAFADYKLPQVLRHMGILVYEEPLAARVDRMDLLAPGSPEEVEIRANTVVAVERIRREALGTGRSLRSFEIDGLLWHMGQGDAFRDRPFHRTATLFY